MGSLVQPSIKHVCYLKMLLLSLLGDLCVSIKGDKLKRHIWSKENLAESKRRTNRKSVLQTVTFQAKLPAPRERETYFKTENLHFQYNLSFLNMCVMHKHTYISLKEVGGGMLCAFPFSKGRKIMSVTKKKKLSNNLYKLRNSK